MNIILCIAWFIFGIIVGNIIIIAIAVIIHDTKVDKEKEYGKEERRSVREQGNNNYN